MFRLRYTSDSLLISVNIFVFVVSRFLFWTFWLSNSSIDKTSGVDIYPTAVLLFEQSKCIDHIQFCFCTVTDSVSPFAVTDSISIYWYHRHNLKRIKQHAKFSNCNDIDKMDSDIPCTPVVSISTQVKLDLEKWK